MRDKDTIVLENLYYNFILNEVRMINQKPEEGFNENETIRVYSGINDPNDVFDFLEIGLSGKDRAKRIHSYESNNNPVGLFVTSDIKVAKYFSHIIIEFHTKIKDLEIPVWPGGSYTVQGEYSKYWENENQRKEAQQKQRDFYKKTQKGDKPEVINSLLNNPERQALFTGDLNSNSIRAIWIAPDFQKSTNLQTFERISPKEFLKKYAFLDTRKKKKSEFKLIKPRDKCDIELFLKNAKKKFNLDENQILEVLKKIDPKSMSVHLFDHQLNDFIEWQKKLPR